MKVVFKTNIDAYKNTCFPTYLTMPPRTGEKVRVIRDFENHFNSQKLPLQLEVVNVTWTSDSVICELWYNATDKKMADLAGAKTL